MPARALKLGPRNTKIIIVYSVSLESKDNVAVLNFASYKKPGGLYFQGVESQEESLCLESTLLPVIEAFKPTYYAWNNKHLNRGMYLDRAFILFEREKQKIYAG